MKKLLITLLTLCLLTALCACTGSQSAGTELSTNAPTEVPDEVMVNTFVLTKRTDITPEGSGVFDFSYDDNYRTISFTQSTNGINDISTTYDLFLKTEVAHEHYYEGKPASSDYREYEYDQHGNPTQYRIYTNDSLVSTTIFENTYDGDQLVKVSETKDGELLSQICYDEAGRIIEDIQYSLGEEISREEYLYNKDGNLAQQVYYLLNQENQRYIFTYDDNGNLINKTSHFNYGTHNVSYEYSEIGKITLIRYSALDHLRYTLFTYDEAGNLIEYQEYCTYAQDDDGNLIDCLPDELNENTFFTQEKKCTCSYSDGKLVKEVLTDNNSTYTALYSYDDNGCLSSCEEWVNDYLLVRYIYEYAPATISTEISNAISEYIELYFNFRDPHQS